LNETSRDFEARDLIEVMDEAHNYNEFLIETLLGWGAPYRRVLDFGAGNGRFAGALHEAGRQVVALEPDRVLRGEIAARGIAVAGALDELRGGERFDGAYSVNVLEHIENDGEILRQLRSLLRPGGGLYLYVPAFQLLFSANDRRVGHFRRYRRNALVALARSAGFEVSRAEYVDFCGFWAALLYRMIGNADGDLNVGTVKLYDRVVFPVSRAMDTLTSRFAGKNLLIEATAA
jgi:SAM-dependent methyltransferase